MSDLFVESDDGATQLTPEETRDLIPAHISYRYELNDAEQENIARAQDWAMRRRRDLLSQEFIMDLHKRMLCDVWRWAGKFRMSARNIGIDYWSIPVALRHILDDSQASVQFKTYTVDEIAVRLHHRLVWVHLFPNGNGRHARLMADLFVMQLGGERFTWGRVSLRDPGEMRARYIEALRAADNHDISQLLVFARA